MERDRIAGEAGVGADDGDDAAGEEALVELPDVAVEVDGAVLADAAAAMDGQRGGERRLVDGAAARAGPRLGRGLAEEAAVRCAVVVLVEERREAHPHVVQRGHAAEVVEAAGAQRAPESLHLAARRCVVGSGVDQRDAEALAAQPQRHAAVGAAVVEIDPVGGAVAAQRGQQQVEHVDLALGVVGLERDHVARGVVEHRVDAQRLRRRPDAQRRSMTHVAVP